MTGNGLHQWHISCHLSCFNVKKNLFTDLLIFFNEIFLDDCSNSLLLGRIFEAIVMKAVILTSSIFYLLGLKMAQNIETPEKPSPQSEINPVKQEQVVQPVSTDHQEMGKSNYVVPKNDLTPTETDSGKITIIRKNTPHLLEKME